MRVMENIEKEAIRLVKQKIKEKGWNSSILAKKMGLHPSTIAKLLQSDRLSLGRITELSELLEYNFLRVFADQLNLDNPPKYVADEAAQERIRERIRELEIENATLLKVLGK